MASSTDRLLSLVPGALALDIKPTPVEDSGASPPENSELRKIAEDVLGALKYSFAAVAARPDLPTRTASVEAAFKEGLTSLPPEKQQNYQRTAAPLLAAPVAVRALQFGRAGQRSAEEHVGAVGGFARFEEGLPPLALDTKLLGVKPATLRVPTEALRSTPEGLLIPSAVLPRDFESFASDFESARESALGAEIADMERLADIWGPLYKSDPFANAAESEFEELAVTNKMGFWITQVKCVDETNPEWLGSDEIALAGVTVDETGDTLKVPEKFIGGGFDDGNSKSYPNWRYHWFNLNEGSAWPKTYSVSLLLAEKDHGGLSKVLNTVWEKVRDKVKEAIAKAVSGALSGLVGPAIASAIGQAVAWIVNALGGWIINAFKDDIFPPYTARVTTPSMSARWNYPNGQWGNPSSGIRTAHFYGHGGHYTVQYYWKFFA
jgi:hypothetical protein